MSIKDLLKSDLPLISQIVDKTLIEKIELWFNHWREGSSIERIRAGDTQEAFLIFLLEKTTQLIAELEEIKNNHSEFRKKFAKAVDDREKKDVVIEYGTSLAYFKPSLYEDKVALDRWLYDDAIDERFEKISIKIQKSLIFLIDRVGVVFRALVKELDEEKRVVYWNQIGILDYLKPLLNIKTDLEILKVTLKSLATALSSLGDIPKEDLIEQQEEKFIYRLSLESHQDVWVQSYGLLLLSEISKESFFYAAKRRISHPKGKDDIFVRYRIFSIIKEKEIDDELFSILKLGAEDESPFVRQGVLKALGAIQHPKRGDLLKEMLVSQEEDSVKAEALDTLHTIEDESEYMETLCVFLQLDHSPYGLRYGMDSGFLYIKNSTSSNRFKDFTETLERIIQNSPHINIRRWAGEYLLKVEGVFLTREDKDLNNLAKRVEMMKTGESITIDKNLVAKEGFYTLLSALALDNFSLDLKKTLFSYKIYKGEFVTSKLWRFLYETRWTSPDKREAHNHTEGRDYRGDALFPTNKLAEVTPTKVPGEPVHISKYGGWLNFLPLPSHINFAIQRSLLRNREPLKIFTSEGKTEIRINVNIFKRFWLFLWSNFNFSKIATLRSEVSNGDKEERAYKEFLAKKGVEMSFTPTKGRDSSVGKFFAGGLFLDPNELYVRLEEYFVSAYDNSLLELSFFALTLTGFFTYSHIRKYKKFKKARKSLPLVIGGWGTRGKSGTERIKAAMFNALGYSIVSKTTGCEAMFLHSRGHSSLKEMFLFRPYDKATIWEQYDLVRLASHMETDIFLWECMGLTPSYIEILQQQWMRDDLATITNTYPDHENLQGPAGRDIPQVMRNFIPKNSVLITSEEEMTPILEEETKEKQSFFKSVGWREAGKIPPDILERIPYDEHPYNIALVKELGTSLGIEEDLALKSMADFVIPDIGVLKTFPVATYKQRELEFINGMSANERFGTISNWNRIGLYDFTLDKNPEVFISTVINNRADRVSRSRVFADIIAFDLNADLHFLIGTNQNGFMLYLKESFLKNRDKLLLFKEDNPLQELETLSKRFRLPTSIEDVKKRAEIIKIRSQKEIEEQNIFIKKFSRDLSVYEKIKDLIEKKENPEIIEKTFQEDLLEIILERVVIIEDPNTSGDEIIDIIAENTPIGLTNKIMGLQNIKGTGLDFVYRFLSWEQCYLSCQKIQSPRKNLSLEGIGELSKFKEFGPLSFQYVEEILRTVKETSIAQSEYYQAEIENILALIESIKKETTTTAKSPKNNNKAMNWLLNTVESFLDAGDAIKRKKEVELIYKDLINYRISHQRAAVELKRINKRQKGGWIFRKGRA